MASRMPNRTRSVSRDAQRDQELETAPEMIDETEEQTDLVAVDDDSQAVAYESRGVGAAAVGAVVRRHWTENIPSWIPKYVREAIIELDKVTWPTQREAVNLTTIVIVFAIVFVAVFGLLDLAFLNGLQAIIDKVHQ